MKTNVFQRVDAMADRATRTLEAADATARHREAELERLRRVEREGRQVIEQLRGDLNAKADAREIVYGVRRALDRERRIARSDAAIASGDLRLAVVQRAAMEEGR